MLAHNLSSSSACKCASSA